MAVSNKQLNFYFEACARKGVAPKDVSALHGGQIYDLTQEILALPNLAHPNQIELLRNLIQEMVDGGVPGVKQVGDLFYKKLTAPRAQEMIDQARQIRAKHFDILPATEQQIERLAQMYLFPEVEWESITKQVKVTDSVYVYPEDGGEAQLTPRAVTYTEEVVIQRKVYIQDNVAGVEKPWRYMTNEEFANELKKLSHQQASNLLDRYTGAFEAWRRTRITRAQKTQIRNIEDRLATIYTPKEVTAFELDMPFNIEGMDTDNVNMEESPFRVKSKKVDNWNPVAYEGLKEQQLDMMSRDEADRYIRQLRYELQNAELRNIGGAQNLDYTDYGIEEARTAKTEADARTKEFKELNNFLYGLSDVSGVMFETTDKKGNPLTVESLRHDALQTFFNYGTRSGAVGGASDERKAELRGQIVDFVKMALDSRAIKFDGLMRLADRSDIANEVVDSLIEDKDYAQKLMKLQRRQY